MVGRQIKFTDEQLRELYNETLSISDIARRFGVKSSTIQSRARKLGLSKPMKMIEKECVVCGVKFKTIYQRRVYCSKKCLYKKHYRVWGHNPKCPSIQKSFQDISESLKRIESMLRERKETSVDLRHIQGQLRYIQERMGFIFIHLPDLAKQAGYALDGVPKMIKESRGGS